MMYDDEFMDQVLPKFHELGITDPKEIEIILDGLNQLAEIGWAYHVHKQQKNKENDKVR